MSNLTTEVFGDMNYLYEHIANRDAQQLNENSDHYDEETTELVADILATISSSMVYEGYSANAIITFLATSSEQDIIEKYLSFDENILTESTVSEDYIVEQLEIFDFAINEGLGDGAIKLLGRIASKPARMRVDKILSGAKNPEEARKMLQRVSQNSARNANVGGYSPTMSPVGGGNLTGKQSAELLTKAKLGQGVQKVKDIAKSAKTALTSPTANKIGLTALGLGALVGLPYAGAKLAGAGSGGQGPSPAGGKPGTPGSSSNTDFMKGSALAKLGGREGRIKGGEFRTMGWSQQSADRYNKAKGATTPPAAAKPPASAKPATSSSGGGSGSGGGSKPAAKPAQSNGPAGETKMQKWARLNPVLASRVKPGQSGYQEISQTRVKPGPYEKQNQTPSSGPEVSNAQKSQAGADVAAIQAKERANFEKKNKEVMASTQKESYNAYELVLEYLFDYGHADTIEEAEYLMTELDESFIQSLVETYEANVLAEEVTEWVNELIEEGHDLSEYTWDDMVDYYFTEHK